MDCVLRLVDRLFDFSELYRAFLQITAAFDRLITHSLICLAVRFCVFGRGETRCAFEEAGEVVERVEAK